MTEELDEIRLKEPDELEDDEIKILRENKDDLTDEEKESYKDVLVEKKEEKEGDEKDKPITFETQGDFDTAVDKRVKGLKEEAETKKAEEEEAKKEKRFWPKKKKFTDVNEFVKDLLPIIRKDRDEQGQQQRERMTEISKQMDSETEDLRKIDPSIPSAGSKKRRDFDRSIAEIMLKDPKVTSITKAYGVYKVEQGDSKKKQTDTAGKVGGGSGGDPTAKPPKYKKFASRDMDDAEEAALKKFKTLPK